MKAAAIVTAERHSAHERNVLDPGKSRGPLDRLFRCSVLRTCKELRSTYTVVYI